MKILKFMILLLLAMIAVSACSQKEPDRFVFVKGGSFLNTNSNYHGESITISDFFMGKYEVTQKEWIEVMGSNPSQFTGDSLPVQMVNWYDCIEYCNKRSIKEGFEPYYTIDKSKKDPNNISEYDNLKWTVTINKEANGYRLPTETEWEYAASGGQKSKNYKYSGSNTGDEVAWYWRNAGDEYLSGDWLWPVIEANNDKAKSAGSKKPNELGFYDMSGNVREWCWDWYVDPNISSGSFRTWRGGGWIGDITSCEFSYRGKFEANGKGADQGFRVCRSG